MKALPPVTSPVVLPLSIIRTDGGTQPRDAMNPECVADYAERFRVGDVFPPLLVYHDGTHHWLADGFHRYRAAEAAGRSDLPCLVTPGTRDDALWACVGANLEHGLRRSNADKRRAVEMAMQLRPTESNREVAKHCGVSDHTVAALRPVGAQTRSATPNSAKPLNHDPRPERRIAADGRAMPVSQPPRAAPPPPAVDPFAAERAAAEKAEREASGAAIAGKDAEPVTFAHNSLTPARPDPRYAPPPPPRRTEERVRLDGSRHTVPVWDAWKDEPDEQDASAPSPAETTRDESGRLTDARGIVVPERIAADWRWMRAKMAPLLARVDTAIAEVRQSKSTYTRIGSALGAEGVTGKVRAERFERLRDTLGSAGARLDALRAEVASMTPTELHDSCAGRGCPGCDGLGWALGSNP